ncbi:hypothetical protein AAG656_27635 [Streptomyces albidoflavus]|uniref:hypothetical protein n=1 Tax=Streptomyces albidoflavus TaxID=1886 RepID=UPI00315A7581
MHQDNPLITFEREGPHITAWTSASSSPVVSEDPKEDHRYGYLTDPLRRRGLEVTVEYGLSDCIVHAALPDGSSLIISPPQEPPSEGPEFPRGLDGDPPPGHRALGVRGDLRLGTRRP